MKSLNCNEMFNVSGGISISGTLINSFCSGLKTFFSVGEYLGSAIRRLTRGKLCPL